MIGQIGKTTKTAIGKNVTDAEPSAYMLLTLSATGFLLKRKDTPNVHAVFATTVRNDLNATSITCKQSQLHVLKMETSNIGIAEFTMIISRMWI